MKKKNAKRSPRIFKTLALLLLATVLFDQWRLPPAERTWHGQIAGFIPYDFRLPTFERIREKIWNADTSRILMPHLFGVGWSLNLYPLFYPVLSQRKEEEPPV